MGECCIFSPSDEVFGRAGKGGFRVKGLVLSLCGCVAVRSRNFAGGSFE